MVEALWLVYRQPAYTLAALLLFPLAAIFYAWAGEVLIVSTHGPSILIEPDVITAIVVLAILVSLSLPLQVYAARLAVGRAAHVGGTGLGVLVGTASMSCCAPVLLPAVLSLIGFSGTTILSVNLTVHRYFVPLAMLGALLLGYSVVATATSVARTRETGSRVSRDER